jgi:hypothetical protein
MGKGEEEEEEEEEEEDLEIGRSCVKNLGTIDYCP